jgi:hypothetical protein
MHRFSYKKHIHTKKRENKKVIDIYALALMVLLDINTIFSAVTTPLSKERRKCSN